MSTLTHPQNEASRQKFLEILHDSRFWAVIGIILFTIGFAVLLSWVAVHQPASPEMPRYYYPYGPYGPMPIPGP